METKDKLMALSSAYTTKTVNDAERVVLNESCPLYAQVCNVQFKLNEDTHSFEVDYSIMSDACDALSAVDADDIDEVDNYELAMNTASVYTAEQLSWLNIWNQAEISEIVREHGCDIGTACAVWYEQQVALAIEMLLQDIINNETV